MKTWILKSLVFAIATLIYLFGQYFRGVWTERFPFLCLYKESPTGAYCNWPYFDSIGWPLIAAGQILAIAGLILLFANKEGLRKWLWMSAVYLPLGALIVFNIPTESHAWALSLTPSREHATWLLGYGYLFLTFIIVAGTRYAARKKSLSAQ